MGPRSRKTPEEPPSRVVAAGSSGHLPRVRRRGPTVEPVAIANIVHLIGDHIQAGRRAGLTLLELREQLVNAEWVEENRRLFGEPRLAGHVGHPVSFAMVWAGSAATSLELGIGPTAIRR